MKEKLYERHDGPMHGWFGLSYASYLVLPRALIQEMPVEWQQKMKALLEELDTEFKGFDDEYFVQTKGEKGKFIKDPLRKYRYADPEMIDALRN